MRRILPPVYRDFLRTRGQADFGEPGLTWRSLPAGLAMVLCVCLGAQSSIWLLGSSELTWSYFPVAVGTPFVVLLLINAALHRWSAAHALNQSELVTVLVMGLAVSGIPAFTVGYVLAVPTMAVYGASPENGWAEAVVPHLPSWAVVTDEETIRLFYEGGADGVPLADWAMPLLWWGLLLLAVYLLSFCLAVLLRRQWVERERLPYPLAEVPLLLTRQQPGDRWPEVLRSPVFWIGAAVPFGLIGFNVIGYFHTGWPMVPMLQVAPIQILPHAPIYPLLFFPVIGFCYLVSTPVTFSIWFFYLLCSFEGGTLDGLGFSVDHPDAYVWGWQAVDWQSWGAFQALVAWSLWQARSHLAQLWRHLRRPDVLDDGAELIPLRPAMAGVAGTCLFIVGWLVASGLTVAWALGLLAGALVIYIGITRLVVQTGVPYLTTPMTAQGMLLAVGGTAGVPAPALVGLALSYAWIGDVQSVLMPAAAHAARLNELCRHRRRLALAMALALVLALVVSTAFVLHLCYDIGAVNFRSWFFNVTAGAGSHAYNPVVQQLREPWSADGDKLGLFAIGAVAYLALAWLNVRLPWWPLHPAGLPLATTWMTQRVVFSVFVAWMLKSLVLRFGGPGAYQRLRPFFLGLVVGFFLGVGLSFAVDVLFFYGSGHPILNG